MVLGTGETKKYAVTKLKYIYLLRPQCAITVLNVMLHNSFISINHDAALQIGASC